MLLACELLIWQFVRDKMPLVIHGCGCKFKAAPNMEIWSSSTSDQLWILNLPLQDNSLPISFLLSVVNPIMNLFRDGLYRSLGMMGMVYGIGLPPGFFLHFMCSFSIDPVPGAWRRIGATRAKAHLETGEGREAEDLEIWMNFDDFYREKGVIRRPIFWGYAVLISFDSKPCVSGFKTSK